MRKRPLLWVLFPTYLLTAALAMLAVALGAFATLRDFDLRQTTTELTARARLFATLLPDRLDPTAVDELCKAQGRATGTRFTVILPSGLVIGDSDQNPANMNNHSDRPEIQKALAGEVGSAKRYSFTERRDMVYVAVPLMSSSSVVSVARASIPLTTINSALGLISLRLFIAVVLVILPVALVSWWVTRRVAGNLAEIRQGAARFARGDFHPPLGDTPLVEFTDLAHDLNRMAEQLNERIHAALRQRNELESVLAGMTEGVVAVSPEESIIRINPAAGQLLGIDLARAQERMAWEVIRHPDL